MTTSTLELVAIGQDMAAQLAHLSLYECVLVSHVLSGIVMGEFPTEQQRRDVSEMACAEISAAIRSAAEGGVRP